MSDWLTDWLVDSDWLIDWNLQWLTEWLTDWLVGSDWLIDWNWQWLTDWLTVIDWLSDWLNNQLTNAMEQSPSWKANSSSASQEISRILRNP
jgi:hypothetical protein